MRWSRTSAIVVVAALMTAAGCTQSSSHVAGSSSTTTAGGSGSGSGGAGGIHKIKHVIVIMQENRSFDSYFGTFPGAQGIPMAGGVPAVCIPDPPQPCQAPYHDTADVNGGGPHGEASAQADVHGGAMDGFIEQALSGKGKGCTNPNDPACTQSTATAVDAVGYHTQAEIPNYWAYARDFVLDDHMFEPVKSWSLPDHLFMVSAWSARCANTNPYSCVNEIVGPYSPAVFDRAVVQEVDTGTTSIDLAWTDITWLLYHHDVSWAYYVETGRQPDCANDSAETCPAPAQSWRTPGIWNPLPLFTDVKADRQIPNVQPLNKYFAAAKAGTLPAVSWVTPSNANGEHPPASVHQGQAYVTAVVNAAMKSPDWSSTAIFLSWDDWGGFYDNLVPPTVDADGYGLRVPSIVISPYAKTGYLDHQTLSSDAYLKFIEDDFLGGARLDPAADGRPDPRPDVRENASILGNLVEDFDFSQRPRKPVLLPTNPPSDSPTLPSYFVGSPACPGCMVTPPSQAFAQTSNTA